ncbi:3-oxoacyl-[acyl-carrier protein] reductase (EC [Olavius algarvensis associated proteobacterium Delta 3]|nr:3-oxoacyl-[acyl-carrier protein] reductase (EC [Olavius algarvensis associated proteobacterium Delta 3]
MNSPQTVLITGSSSGFGLLTTRLLLEKGFTVIATMRGLEGKNAQQANEIRKFSEERPGVLYLRELDVTDEVSVDQTIQDILDTTEGIDVVVNNAGFGIGGFAEGCTVDQMKRIFDVNLFGVQRVNRAVLPSMREQGSGLLIHRSSVMGRIVIPYAAFYTATKFALEGLTESYSYELEGTGVDVSIIEPGGFGTGFMAKMEEAGDMERVKTYGALLERPKQIWGSVGEMIEGDNAPNPQDVADAVLNLIETPQGKRPLRVVVDPLTGGEGAKTLNDAAEQIQHQLLSSFGL